jgi:hypothetical protein
LCTPPATATFGRANAAGTGNPQRHQGLLEPCAVPSRTHGSEGAGTQQCVPATRRQM